MRACDKKYSLGQIEAVPLNVAKCPECGDVLIAMFHSIESASNRPTRGGLVLECGSEMEFGSDDVRHRFWQSDWQPVIDRVCAYYGVLKDV